MKPKCRIIAAVFITMLIFPGCTKEDPEIVPEQQVNKGSLSFGSFIGNLVDNNKTAFFKSYKLGMPECSNKQPQYIRVALKNSKGVWITGINGGNHFIEIKVDPSGVDLDKDGEPDSWFTKELDQILLPVDNYTLEYFAVLDGNGPDANILYLAPRENEVYGPTEFQNFVNAPLPIPINIREGVKHYVPVEVLCYDLRFAFAYGYIFFNFNETPLLNICSKGSICNEITGKVPAKYRFKVWSYSEDEVYNDKNLLVNAINYFQTDQGIEVNPRFADGLCFPLPDSPEEDIYYAEIFITQDNEEEKIIRKGIFTDTFWKANINEDKTDAVFEFIDGCCNQKDNFDLLTDVTNTGDCD